MKKDKYTDQIVDLFSQANAGTQVKMLAAVMALTEGSEEEQQILKDFADGKKKGMQKIYDKYVPRVMALMQERTCCGCK